MEQNSPPAKIAAGIQKRVKENNPMKKNIMQNRTVLMSIRIVILALLVYGIYISGKFMGLLNGPGLAFVLIGGAAAALMSFSWGEIRSAFLHAFGKSGTDAELFISSYFWEACVRNFWMLGILGTIISFIIALSQSGGGIGDIANRMSYSFLSMLYGLILAIICLVPLLRLKQESDTTKNLGPSDMEIKTSGLLYNYTFGSILFIAVFIGTVFFSYNLLPMDGPLDPISILVCWPALLTVVGGTVLLALFIGGNNYGYTFTLGFALTGLLGSLTGFVQALLALSNRSIEDVASAITFVLSSCFIALLGMILVGIPFADRSVKASRAKGNLALSRIVWFVFPLITLIFLALTFLAVITPMQKSP